MSGSIARKAGVLLAGGSVYVTAVYMTYHWTHLNKEASALAAAHPSISDDNGETTSNFSYLTNPLRTCQFQRIASIYDDRIGRDEFFMGLLLLRRSLIYFHARGDVLEVGAGTARNLRYYNSSSAVKRVVITDFTEQMLEQAKKKIGKECSADQQKRFAVVQADATNLKFPADTFDTVVDTFGLCSYDDPIVVLREMARVCKADGKILLLEHGRSKEYDFVTRHLDKHAEIHAANWGCVWNRDLDEILQRPESGLEIDKLKTWHFGTTYYVVCRPRKQQHAKDQ